MLQIIINADDCGYDSHKNEQIKLFIEKGLITSTTIMANGKDLEHIKGMYEQYADISFGVHLNLTELKALRYSQELVERGFMLEDGTLNCNEHRYSLLCKSTRQEIYKELKMQIEKILDMGINISHVDSHHHIHRCPTYLPVFAKVMKEFHLSKVRRLSNYGSRPKLARFVSQQWIAYLKLFNSSIITTDYFESYEGFIHSVTSQNIDSKTIELMCHPGGIYPEESLLMEQRKLSELNLKFKLINYNQLTNIS